MEIELIKQYKSNDSIHGYNIAAGGLISGIWHYYAKNTGNYLTSISFWILIIIVVILVQLVQEVGLYISKKLDKRRI